MGGLGGDFLGSFCFNTFDAQCCPEYETTINNMSATLAFGEDIRRWTEPQRGGHKRQPNHTPPATRERTQGAVSGEGPQRSLCRRSGPGALCVGHRCSVSGPGAAFCVGIAGHQRATIQSANSSPPIRPADLRFRPSSDPRATHAPPSSDALCIGERRSRTQRALGPDSQSAGERCMGPALFVSGPALSVSQRSVCRGPALCVGPRRSLPGILSEPGALCVGARRSLHRARHFLRVCVGAWQSSSQPLCVRPAVCVGARRSPAGSVSGPALFASGPALCPAPSGLFVGVPQLRSVWHTVPWASSSDPRATHPARAPSSDARATHPARRVSKSEIGGGSYSVLAP